MEIKLLDDTDSTMLRYHIQDTFNVKTRFTCHTDIIPRKRSGDVVRVRNIRLKDPKKWCGSHPFSCDVQPGAGVKPMRRSLLEGADWVEFNDQLNDILDDLNISANVSSVVCILRKDTRRRIIYNGHYEAFQTEWDKDEYDEGYEDWCGRKAPASVYPEGTPGLYERSA